jgi:hypothetical protein
VAELERAAEFSKGSPMRTRTRAGLLTRLERLECRFAERDQPIKLRLGHLKRLPREYQGERHVIFRNGQHVKHGFRLRRQSSRISERSTL